MVVSERVETCVCIYIYVYINTLYIHRKIDRIDMARESLQLGWTLRATLIF